MKLVIKIVLAINIACFICCAYQYIANDSLINFLVGLYIVTFIFRLVLELKDPGFWNFFN